VDAGEKLAGVERKRVVCGIHMQWDGQEGLGTIIATVRRQDECYDDFSMMPVIAS